MEQIEIIVKSTLDSSKQPSLLYKSETNEKRPLLVGLHTWSNDRFNQINNMLPYAEKYDFNGYYQDISSADESYTPQFDFEGL